MIKTNKNKILPNLDSGCVRILNYVYAWLNHVHAYLMMRMHAVTQIQKISFLEI